MQLFLITNGSKRGATSRGNTLNTKGEMIMILKSILSAALVIFSSSAYGELPGLESAYLRHLSKTKNMIMSQSLIKDTIPNTCSQQVIDIRADGKIDILVAFGYMDVSNGQQFKDTGNYLYGPGDVLDIDAKNALRSLLKSPCPSAKKIFACGFRGNGDTLQKKIKDRWSKTRLKVTVTLLSPSVTGVDAINVSSKASQQEKKSQQAKQQFLQALTNKDAVLYLGHARSGGGPDFYPPVLKSNGKVDYSYYKSKKEGIRSMLGALEQTSTPASVIGVLACNSTGLFSASIKKRAPNSILVTAADLFDYNDILPTGYAMLEAIVSQRCASEFSNVSKVQPGSSKFLRVSF